MNLRHRMQALGSSRSRVRVDGTDELAMFSTMQALKRFGGVISGDAMAARLADHWAQPVSVLARWIVDRRVVHLSWHGTLLLPVFQFAPTGGNICCDVAQVIAQLVSVLDACESTTWFVQPHALLHGDLPLRLIKSNMPLVIEAARATHLARAS